MKILILSTNPKETERLRFDIEFKEIKDSISVSKNRDKFNVVFRRAIKPKDLQDLINKEKPEIIHFSGHCNSKGELILEDEIGDPIPISTEIFERIFNVSNNHTICVVLNCCYSAITAKEISKYVDCVIGMKTAIADGPAIAFAAGFYLAIVSEIDLKTAFEFAQKEFILKGGLSKDKPELYIKSGINPSETYFIKEND